MCKLSGKDQKKIEKKEQKYKCTKCKRTAHKKDKLCKPESIH